MINTRANDRSRGIYRNRSNRLAFHEVFKLNQNYLENLYWTGNYKRFFVITLEDGGDTGVQNAIKENKDLEMILRCESKKITELRESTQIEVHKEQKSIRDREIT